VWAYGPGGAEVAVKLGPQAAPMRTARVRVGRAPPFTAGLPWDVAAGTDGSLALLVDGQRLDRYEDGQLVSSTYTPAGPVGNPALAPDNCAALSVVSGAVQLIDLGCFPGDAPRTFPGVYAAWSPDGEWIAVAESDAVAFHRVVGPETTVRWDMAVGQLAWIGD
jgi:hypothetical protein